MSKCLRRTTCFAEKPTVSAEADVGGDAATASRLNAEREALVKELSSTYGLGGRPRSLGGGNERARKTVTARVHDTLGRIDVRHPPAWKTSARVDRDRHVLFVPTR